MNLQVREEQKMASSESKASSQNPVYLRTCFLTQARIPAKTNPSLHLLLPWVQGDFMQHWLSGSET